MATLSEIENRVVEASAEGFRGRLMARGEAQSKMRRDGALPPGAPDFIPTLEYDLLSYGYSLLRDGLAILEQIGDPNIAQQAFISAAQAIEFAIQNGKVRADTDFHRFVAASAYHLARMAARAYSLLIAELDSANLSPAERVLCLLMVRNLEALNREVRDYKFEGSGSDEALIDKLAGASEDSQSDDTTDDPLHSLVSEAITDTFFSGMAEALLALEQGDPALIQSARETFRTCEGVAGEADAVNQWWFSKLASFLISDLWDASFHQRLPHAPLGDYSAEWERLRALFIGSLLKRNRAEIELWPSQLEAAERAVDQSDSMVVSLPTSAGKTRIAELCILSCLAAGKRVMFVTPLRALSAQTENGLKKTFGPLGATVSSLYGSIGSSGVDDDLLRTRDIIVATPEKLDFALRSDPSLLNDIGLIVLDEGHMIGLGEREIRYEVQIQRLLRRKDAPSRRIVCLSAILPSDDRLEDFVSWLTSDSDAGLVEKDWRPTRLRFGEVDWREEAGKLEIYVGDDSPWISQFLTSKFAPKGNRTNPFPMNQRELCVATAWQMIDGGQTVLIYCPEKRGVEPYAREIVRLFKQGLLHDIPKPPDEQIDLALAIGQEWFPQDHPILQCLKKGVVIHHGSLPTPFRREVERLLRSGKVYLTVSSPTLAQGLNLTATVLIFHGLKRGRDTIEVSQFRNVIGRAGRAFVDVEGLVLLPIYKDHKKNRSTWNDLINNAGGKEMESGLLLLVRYLAAQIIKRNDIKNIKEFIEYVSNQNAWEFPKVAGEKPEIEQELETRWYGYIAQLDTAILSLVGEADEAQSVALEDLLDELLKSSLWERRLKRTDEMLSEVIQRSLKARAEFIWERTTSVQRKAYYLAGVGIKTGTDLDANADRLLEHLVSANGAILLDQDQEAIQEICAFAEIAFEIPPFTPNLIPENWRAIVESWLKGKNLVGIASKREELDFIEDALIYRLPWAMESVRVWASAHNADLGSGLTVDDFELGCATTALETGALSVPTALLIQAGFHSRSGAYAATGTTDATFTNAAGFRAWLGSEEVRDREREVAWPTFGSRAAWDEFRQADTSSQHSCWSEQVETIPCAWTSDHYPNPDAPVRVFETAGRWRVYSPDYTLIGECTQDLGVRGEGLLTARVSSDRNGIVARYLGPTQSF